MLWTITVTKILSQGLVKYVDIIVNNDFENYPENLKKAVQIVNGHISDDRIVDFRKKQGF